MSEKTQKDLVQVIRDNPGCVATVDNDWWALHKKNPDQNPFEEGDDEWDDWEDDNRIADSSDVKRIGDGGYGSGNCYGGDILQALAIIVGIKVESV